MVDKKKLTLVAIVKNKKEKNEENHTEFVKQKCLF